MRSLSPCKLRRPISLAAASACALVSLALSAPARATTFEEGLTLRRIWELSTHVVVADVVAQQVVAALPGAPAPVETHTELRVAEYLKGEGPEALTVRQLGGATADGVIQISGDAQLRIGQRAVLLVNASDDPRYRGFVHLTALGYSAYTIERGAHGWLARPSLLGPSPEASAQTPQLGRPVAWDQLRPFLLRGAR